jgi:adenylosuccinate synthase
MYKVQDTGDRVNQSRQKQTTVLWNATPCSLVDIYTGVYKSLLPP